MKKVLAAGMILAVISASVFAAGLVYENAAVSEAEKSFVSESEIKRKIDENLTQSELYKNPEEFACIVDCFDRARYENICAYISFMAKNDFTDEQLEVINSVLESGTTVQSLMQVYDFWVGTDEDFSIIEEICSMEEDIFGEFWYEDAFNLITNNEHGVLTRGDIDAYEAKGIEAEQILAANILSRKNGRVITEILDNLANGESIEKQAREIYGINAEFDGDKTDLENTRLIVEAQKCNVPEAIQNGAAADLCDVLERADDIYDEILEDKIASELRRLNISEPEPSDADDDLLPSKTGYAINVIHALENKGFTPEEIAKSAEENIEDIFEAAKTAREELMNEAQS